MLLYQLLVTVGKRFLMKRKVKNQTIALLLKTMEEGRSDFQFRTNSYKDGVNNWPAGILIEEIDADLCFGFCYGINVREQRLNGNDYNLLDWATLQCKVHDLYTELHAKHEWAKQEVIRKSVAKYLNDVAEEAKL
jgi:hypothetical protein